jgi:hypothetical protein
MCSSIFIHLNKNTKIEKEVRDRADEGSRAGGQGRGEGCAYLHRTPEAQVVAASVLCSVKFDHGAEGPRRRYLAGGGRGGGRTARRVATRSLLAL